jgi:hypothetical protein
VAVRWYLRYGLSYRDVEELLAERGIEVDHVTIYRWVHRFTPFLIDAARPCRHAPGDRWFVDETSRSAAGGFICTERSTSSGRSLTGVVALGEAEARETVNLWFGQIARASSSKAAATRRVAASSTPSS